MAWRKANREATEEIRTEDKENFIVVRSSLTKAEAGRITALAPTPEDKDRTDKAQAMLKEAFKLLVVDWSMEDEDGEKILPTVEAYDEIDAAAGRWIDEHLMEQMSKTMGVKVQEAEGKLSE